MTLAATEARPAARHGRFTDEPAITPQKRWDVATPDPDAVEQLAKALKTSRPLAAALVNRGFTADDLDACRSFLKPSLTDLDEPTTIPGLDAAAACIA
ncbi:MAG: hypothetical protein AAF561_08335, partial [Planctomycetota bacterium]